MSSITNTGHIEWYREVPRSIKAHTISGVVLMAVSFGGFGAWAVGAPLAAAVVSQGSFVATGQNKIVQHLEGGIIKNILVKEGDSVKAGQTLVQLDGTSARADDRQLFLRRARLEAIAERLEAEQQEKVKVPVPDFLKSSASDPEVKAIIQSQILNFEGSSNKIKSDILMLEANINALEFRAEGYESQKQAMVRQIEFLKDELDGKQILLDQGLIRKNEVNALLRAIADAEGQVGRLSSEVRESRAEKAKFSEQIAQTRNAYRQAASDELQSIEAELDGIKEQYRKAENILKRSSINAPVDGTIVRLYYHTAGGVIESGKNIAEIIPTNVPLIIETQIPRADIDSVHVGQKATVVLTALNQRTTPVLDGQVVYVSADTIADPRTPASREVYVARVSLSPSELTRVKGFSPTPGMPVQVMIQTAERTFVNYITKPIADSMSRAFREQ
jgi:HlyD family type I secretion membrane fusion protein